MRRATAGQSEMGHTRPSLVDIEAAYERIEGHVQRSPLIDSVLGEGIRLKLEIVQPTGTFKVRGATNALLHRLEVARERGVVCCSTGNHARALAYVAARTGVGATVCVSSLVPASKVEALRALGADVRIIGNSQDDAQEEADRLAASDGMYQIPPFDSPDVVSGQGTIGLELMRQAEDIRSILVPLSGGGLASGIAVACKTLNPDIKIVGISMDRGAAMSASIDAGRPVQVEEHYSLADSLGGGIGLTNHVTFQLCRDLLDDVFLVSEADIYRGLRSVLCEERLLVEGAAAVGHAALLNGILSDIPKPTALIMSGRNISSEQAAAVMANRSVQFPDGSEVRAQ